jgi:hypothetical protein
MQMMSRRGYAAASLSVLAIIGVAATHLSLRGAWINSFVVAISAAVAAGFVVLLTAILCSRPMLAIAVASMTLAANAIFIAATVLGYNPLPVAPYGKAGYAVTLCVVSVIGIVGLWQRKLWSRWMCMGLAAAGIVGGAMNAANFWQASSAINTDYPQWSIQMMQSEWAYLVSIAGGLLIWLSLWFSGSKFTKPGVWSSQATWVGWLRVGMVAAFTAVPLLLVYVSMQPLVPWTTWSASVLAGSFVIANTLLHRSKSAGALLLALCGLGLIAQTVVTLAYASDMRIAMYYAVIWLPAALLSAIAGIHVVMKMRAA